MTIDSNVRSMKKEMGMRRTNATLLWVLLLVGAGCMAPGRSGPAADSAAPSVSEPAAAAAAAPASDEELARKRAELDKLVKELEALQKKKAPPGALKPPVVPVAGKAAPKPKREVPPAGKIVRSTPPVPSSATERVISEMKREEALRKQMADDLLKRADAKRRAGDLEAAADLYRRALDAYPKHTEAQQKLDEVLFLLGQRRPTVKQLIRSMEEEEAVSLQERLNRVDRLVAEAMSAMADLRLEEAQFRLQQAQAQLALIPPSREVLDRRERIEARLADVRNLLAKRRQQTKEEQQRQIQKIIEQDRAFRKKIQQEEVKTLLERAMEAYRKQDFKQCIQICEAVLSRESRNLQALGLLRRAREQEGRVSARKLKEEDRYNRIRTLDDVEEAATPQVEPFKFPESSYWEDVVQKRPTEITVSAAEETPEIREIKRRLNTVRINLDFDDRPLSEVIDFIKRLVQINIKIDSDVDPEETKVTLRLNDALLKDALELIMENTGLAYTFRNNLLVITVKEKAIGTPVFKIYNVTDILSRVRNFPGPTLDIRTPDEEEMEAGGGGPGGGTFTFGEEEEETQIQPDDLVQLIKDSTGGDDVWQDPFSIDVHQNQLLVEASPELHAKVRRVLQELRRDSDLFVVVRARFVDISDDFLEDIGIDYRNLGQRNTPWRRTYSSRIPDSRTGGQDPGFTERLSIENPDFVGRMQHILDGFASLVRGDRVFGGPGGLSGLSLQYMMVDPYQVSAILRAVQEHNDVRSVVAPEVTAHNGQRVYVSVITQRSYIADYELVSGGTTYTLTEVADPIVRVNEEGVVLDVRPTVSADRKYITIDVQPTLATLIGGVISTILINLGTVMAAAMQVPIGLPRMSIQRTWTSVTVPNGGTVLLGGFRSMNELKYVSTIPILGQIPILNLLVRRKAEVKEKRSLIILVSAQLIDLRREEAEKFGM